MKNYKKNKGITLIALVVTIIVLLILAGISISMLTGQNGILKRTSQAKKETDESSQEEDMNMKNLEMLIKDNVEGSTDEEKLDYWNKELEKYGGVIYNGKPISSTNKIGEIPATVTING